MFTINQLLNYDWFKVDLIEFNLIDQFFDQLIKIIYYRGYAAFN